MISESLMMKDQTLFAAVKRYPTLSSTQVFFELFDVVVGGKKCLKNLILFLILFNKLNT